MSDHAKAIKLLDQIVADIEMFADQVIEELDDLRELLVDAPSEPQPQPDPQPSPDPPVAADWIDHPVPDEVGQVAWPKPTAYEWDLINHRTGRDYDPVEDPFGDWTIVYGGHLGIIRSDDDMPELPEGDVRIVGFTFAPETKRPILFGDGDQRVWIDRCISYGPEGKDNGIFKQKTFAAVYVTDSVFFNFTRPLQAVDLIRRVVVQGNTEDVVKTCPTIDGLLSIDIDPTKGGHGDLVQFGDAFESGAIIVGVMTQGALRGQGINLGDIYEWAIAYCEIDNTLPLPSGDETGGHNVLSLNASGSIGNSGGLILNSHITGPIGLQGSTVHGILEDVLVINSDSAPDTEQFEGREGITVIDGPDWQDQLEAHLKEKENGNV